MNHFFLKYKGPLLLVFLLLLVSAIDRYVLAGNYTGKEDGKHLYFIGALLLGVLVTIVILLRGEGSEE